MVLGGNGSGKTTLLRCVTRTVKPTAGEIWLGETNLCALEGEKLRRARLELAMIWQHASLVGRRSVLANVASGRAGPAFDVADRARAACRRPNSMRHAAISPRSALRIWPSSAPALCPAARRSASPSPARSRNGRASCWPTSRWRASIQRRRRKSCACCGGWRASERIAVLCVLHQVELAYSLRRPGGRHPRRTHRLSTCRAAKCRARPCTSFTSRGGMSLDCASWPSTLARAPAAGAALSPSRSASSSSCWGSPSWSRR